MSLPEWFFDVRRLLRRPRSSVPPGLLGPYREVPELMAAPRNRDLSEAELVQMAVEYLNFKEEYMPLPLIESYAFFVKHPGYALLHPWKMRRRISAYNERISSDQREWERKYGPESVAIEDLLHSLYESGRLTQFGISGKWTMSAVEHHIYIEEFSESLASEIVEHLRPITTNVRVEPMNHQR